MSNPFADYSDSGEYSPVDGSAFADEDSTGNPFSSSSGTGADQEYQSMAPSSSPPLATEVTAPTISSTVQATTDKATGHRKRRNSLSLTSMPKTVKKMIRTSKKRKKSRGSTKSASSEADTTEMDESESSLESSLSASTSAPRNSAPRNSALSTSEPVASARPVAPAPQRESLSRPARGLVSLPTSNGAVDRDPRTQSQEHSSRARAVTSPRNPGRRDSWAVHVSGAASTQPQPFIGRSRSSTEVNRYTGATTAPIPQGAGAPDDTQQTPSRPHLARTKTITRGMGKVSLGQTMQSAGDEDPVRRDIGLRLQANGLREVEQAKKEIKRMADNPRPQLGWVAHRPESATTSRTHQRTQSTPSILRSGATSSSDDRDHLEKTVRWDDSTLDEAVQRVETQVGTLERTVAQENVRRFMDGQSQPAYGTGQKKTHILVEPRLSPLLPPRVRVLEHDSAGSEPASLETARDIVNANPHVIQQNLRPALTDAAEKAEQVEKRVQKGVHGLQRSATFSRHMPSLSSAGLPAMPASTSLPTLPRLPEPVEAAAPTQSTESTEPREPTERTEGLPPDADWESSGETGTLLSDVLAMIEDADQPGKIGHRVQTTTGRTLSPAQWDEFTSNSYKQELALHTPPDSPRHAFDATSQSEDSSSEDARDGSPVYETNGEGFADFTAFDDVDVFTWRGLEKRLDRQMRQFRRRRPHAQQLAQQQQQLDVLRFAIAELQSDQEHRLKTVQKLSVVQAQAAERTSRKQLKVLTTIHREQHKTNHHVDRVAKQVHEVQDSVGKTVRHLHEMIQVHTDERRDQYTTLVNFLEDMVTHTSEAHRDIRVFAQTYHDQQGIFSELLSKNQQQLNKIYEMHAEKTQALQSQIRKLERQLTQTSTQLQLSEEENYRMRSLIMKHLPHIDVTGKTRVLRSRRPRIEQVAAAPHSPYVRSSGYRTTDRRLEKRHARARGPPDEATSAASEDS